MDEGNSKRRRGLGLVTPNACTECRRRRTKCDGQMPCGRCASQSGTRCTYEIPIRQSKENMRTEIEQLRAQQEASKRVLAALVSSDESALVLDQLRGGEKLEVVAEKLERTGSIAPLRGPTETTYSQPYHRQAIESALEPSRNVAAHAYTGFGLDSVHSDSPLSDQQSSGSWAKQEGENSASSEVMGAAQPDMMAWASESASLSSATANPLVGSWNQQTGDQSNPDATTQATRIQGQAVILGPGFGQKPQGHNYAKLWTTVITDPAFIDHLMALYFCWEYPTFASLDKHYFLEDYRAGSSRYCSPLLVNALLAVGCRYSTQPMARADANDMRTAGDHFFAEAVKLLEQETNLHSLTTVQALGLMSIRQASRGHCSNSLYYAGQSMRLAVEMGLHLDYNARDDDESSLAERTVRSATFWGAFSLDQCWSLAVGKLSHISRDLTHLPQLTNVQLVEDSPWIPYTDDGAPLELNCSQPSNVQSIFRTFCKLSQIVHHSLYTFYTPGTHVTSKSLLNIYNQYLQWYGSIPEVLRLGQNFTPPVLFCHMYYHYGILLLFRPFIKLDIVGSAVSPRDVCQQAAEAISALLTSYDKLYTLRHTPCLVPYLVLASTITHLVSLDSGHRSAKFFQQGMSDLKTMSQNHGFSLRCRRILKYLNAHWGINTSFDSSNDDEDSEDPEKTCRPRSTSENLFSASVQIGDIVCGIKPVQSRDENPLFWPFPLQGRPLLETGELLESSGFKIRLGESSMEITS